MTDTICFNKTKDSFKDC